MSSDKKEPKDKPMVPAKLTKPKDILAMAMDYDESVVIYEPRCVICRCGKREEIEEHWERSQRNHDATSRFLKSYYDIKLSRNAVANHMAVHYLPSLKRTGLKYYAESLFDFVQIKKDRVSEINICKSILMKEMLELAADTQGEGSLNERRKNLELVAKMTNQIMNCQEQERKHEEEWKPVAIVVQKLQDIIDDKKKDAAPETRETLISIIDELIIEVDQIGQD